MKAVDTGREPITGDCLTGPEMQHAFVKCGQVLHPLPGGFRTRKNGTCFEQENLPHRREDDAPPDTVEKSETEFQFQHHDGMTDRRLRQT